MEQMKCWLKEGLHEKKFRRYLFVEVLVIALLVAEFHMLSYGILKIIRYVILLLGLFMISYVDRKKKIIANKNLLELLGIRCILLILEWIMFPEVGLGLLFSAGIGMLLGGGIFLLAYIISRGGIGAGDVKLLAVVGSYVGSGSIFAVVFLTVVAAAIYGIVMLLLKKIKLKEEMPFAPFVLIGTILVMALGM